MQVVTSLSRYNNGGQTSNVKPRMMWLECLGLFLVLLSVLDASSQREVTTDVALNGTFRAGVRAVSGGTLQQLLMQLIENYHHNDRHLQYGSSDLRQTILRRYRRHRSRNGTEVSGNLRRRRHDKSQHSQFSLCQRHDLFVNIERLGWADTVVYPPRFNIRYCAGRCPRAARALGIDTSNHAMLRAIVRVSRRRQPQAPPSSCCVATSLRPMNLLYRDKQQGHYNIWQLNDVIVDACGCR